MFHTYGQALDWIHSRLRLGIKPGLMRMEWMMDRLGHPESGLKSIHVGGTNGKGSTVTFLRSILQQAGYTVGTFTSPYFEQFNERISVNGEPIKDDEIMMLANMILPLAEELETTDMGGPTEFEIITAMAFCYFSKVNRVDAVIFEVGLGGRYDSTNVIKPLLSIITSIGMDHTNILGSTIAQIAYEKAGIIKSGTGIVTAVKQQEALHAIEDTAKTAKAPLYTLGQDFTISGHVSLTKGERFSVKALDQSFHDLEITMMGQHQTENAALAVMACQLLTAVSSFKIDENQIRSGLEQAYWPGRLEVVSEQPLVLIDGAHNDEGITALVHELTNRYHDKKITIMFAALKDKKLDTMMEKIDKMAAKVVLTSFSFPRAAAAMELFAISQSGNKQVAADWQTGLRKEVAGLNGNEMLVVTGSLYFLSEVKPFLLRIIKN